MNDEQMVISRRGFLAGLMASAAIVAVAPQLLVPQAQAIEASDVFPEAEEFDFWVEVRGKWRFIGTCASLSAHRETVDVSTWDSPWREVSLLSDRVDADCVICADLVGVDALRDSFNSGSSRFMIMVREGRYVIEGHLQAVTHGTLNGVPTINPRIVTRSGAIRYWP